VAARTNISTALGSVQATEYYRYDSSTGKPARRDTVVGSTSSFSGLSFAFSQTYNTIGALKALTYPCRTAANGGACTDATFNVGYNYTYGVLSSIDDGGSPPASTWASSIAYQANGLIADIQHASMHEKWLPDTSGMARPATIVARNSTDTGDLWSSGSYQYDAAGNIKTIGNTIC